VRYGWLAAVVLGAALVPGGEGMAGQQQSGQRPRSLAERLGYSASDKLLIINGDDVGMSHAINAATIEALERGVMTSATIMVPCPWFPEIAAYARQHPASDFGLHLTHTSEWEPYRWGPIADRRDVPGLLTPEGYFWPKTADVYAHSSPAEVELEARAQIKKALAAGIDVTHLDTHMGVLQSRLDYYPAYLRLARELDVPVRMASQDLLATMGAGRARADFVREGVLHPDFMVFGGREGKTAREYWPATLRALRPGVTELYIHAALATDDMKTMTGALVGAGWEERAQEHELFARDPSIRSLLEEQGIKRIGFRALRDLQRRERQ
jgi:predicted glycoside hydrolase/deacetylase ChbG (UPF0249 family)